MMKPSNRDKQEIRQLLAQRRRSLFYGESSISDIDWHKKLDKLSYREQVALAEVLNEEAEQEVQYFLPLLANTGDSPEEIAKFRKACRGREFDITSKSDSHLLKFRDELRAVWEQPESDHIVNGWYVPPRKATLQDSISFLKGWIVLLKAKTILPAGRNFRAMAANICIRRAKYLKRCANPKCSKFFIGSRTDAKYCTEPNCVQYGGRVRAYDHWRRKHPSSPIRKKREDGKRNVDLQAR